MSVANTILQQMGGNRFIVMTGSHHFVSDGNTLIMQLARNASKANRLYITLDPVTDLYTMRFFRFTEGRLNRQTFERAPDKITEIKLYEDVFADQLENLFTHVTGLYTSL